VEDIVTVKLERRDLLAAKLIEFEHPNAAVRVTFGDIDFNALHA
jgi:hypothetical protein